MLPAEGVGHMRMDFPKKVRRLKGGSGVQKGGEVFLRDNTVSKRYLGL